jgi:hypothetical protein
MILLKLLVRRERELKETTLQPLVVVSMWYKYVHMLPGGVISNWGVREVERK